MKSLCWRASVVRRRTHSRTVSTARNRRPAHSWRLPAYLRASKSGQIQLCAGYGLLFSGGRLFVDTSLATARAVESAYSGSGKRQARDERPLEGARFHPQLQYAQHTRRVKKLYLATG